MRGKLLRTAAPLAASLWYGLARAGIVTLTGTEFDVRYDTTMLGLFDAPSLIGNDLTFTPDAFSAESLNGSGTSTTSSVASGIQLIAHPGYSFGTLEVAALGDYLMQGVGSSVGITGQLSAVDDSRPLTLTQVNLMISGSTPLTNDNGQLHNWIGTATISDSTPTVTPGHNPWLNQASTIDVSLENTLDAATVPGSGPQQAFIQEKFNGVEIMIDPQAAVPLPGTLPLLLVGLGGIASLAWQRRLASRPVC